MFFVSLLLLSPADEMGRGSFTNVSHSTLTWNQTEVPLATKCLKRSRAASSQHFSVCPHRLHLRFHINSRLVKYFRKSRYLVIAMTNFRSRDVYFKSNLMLYLRKRWAQGDYSLTVSLMKSTEVLFSAPRANWFRLLHSNTQTPTHMHIM